MKPPRALLVEDYQPLLSILASTLERAGWRVETAQDGVEALGWVVAESFDLLACDALLPRLDGLDLVSRLRQGGMLGDTKLLVFGARERRAEARERGADVFLAKPLKAEDFLAAAHDLVAAGRTRRPAPPLRPRKATARTGRGPRPPAPLAEGECPLAGSLAEMSPSQLLSLLSRGSRSGVLELDRGKERVRVILRDELIFAAHLYREGSAAAFGEPALAVALEWREGSYRFQPGRVRSSHRNVFRSTPALLSRSGAVRRFGPYTARYVTSETRWTRTYRAQSEEGATVRIVVGEDPPRRPKSLAALRAFSSPAFARFLGCGRTPSGERWHACERPDGPTLQRRVAKSGGGPQAVQLGRELYSALSVLHAADLCHGGLDACRLVASARGLCVLDLGIVRPLRFAHRLTRLCAAPELYRGEAPSAASDVYAAACLIYFAFSAQHPFAHANPRDLELAHLNATPLPLEHPVWPTLAQALAKDPAQRPSAAALTRRFQEQLGLAGTMAQDSAAAPPTPATPATPRSLQATIKEQPPTASLKVQALPDPPPGYTITRRIGSGGMGEVFAGRHEGLARDVAIKLTKGGVNPVDQGRFLREARLAAALDHSGVVRVYDVGKLGERLYLVMELVRGDTLQEVLERDGPFAERELRPIATQLLEALEVAHGMNVLHRDIKPENVLLIADTKRVKIADFGIARSLDGNTDLTAPGTILGSPYYMSPEQCRGEDLDARADLYSLGGTLYCLLAGRPPFVGDSINDLLRQQLLAEPQPIAELAKVSPDFAALIHDMLRKDRAGRPTTCAEVRARLDGLPALA